MSLKPHRSLNTSLLLNVTMPADTTTVQRTALAAAAACNAIQYLGMGGVGDIAVFDTTVDYTSAWGPLSDEASSAVPMLPYTNGGDRTTSQHMSAGWGMLHIPGWV